MKMQKQALYVLTELIIFIKIRGSKYVEVNQPMPFEFIKKQLNDGKKGACIRCSLSNTSFIQLFGTKI